MRRCGTLLNFLLPRPKNEAQPSQPQRRVVVSQAKTARKVHVALGQAQIIAPGQAEEREEDNSSCRPCRSLSCSLVVGILWFEFSNSQTRTKQTGLLTEPSARGHFWRSATCRTLAPGVGALEHPIRACKKDSPWVMFAVHSFAVESRLWQGKNPLQYLPDLFNPTLKTLPDPDSFQAMLVLVGTALTLINLQWMRLAVGGGWKSLTFGEACSEDFSKETGGESVLKAWNKPGKVGHDISRSFIPPLISPEHVEL